MQRKPGPGEAEQQEQLTSYAERWHLQRPGGQRWCWEPCDPLRAFPELMVLCGSQQSPAAHGLARARIQPTSRRCVEGKDRASPAAMAKPLVPPCPAHSGPGTGQPHGTSHRRHRTLTKKWYEDFCRTGEYDSGEDAL